MLNKVTPGQPIKNYASDWNHIIDATNKVLNPQGQSVSQSQNVKKIRVQNTTDTAIDRYGIIGLSDPVILPADNENSFKNQIVLKGIKPAKDKPFVILQEPAGKNAIAEAMIVGITPVMVSVTATTDTYADIVVPTVDSDVSGYTHLVTASAGNV